MARRISDGDALELIVMDDDSDYDPDADDGPEEVSAHQYFLCSENSNLQLRILAKISCPIRS